MNHTTPNDGPTTRDPVLAAIERIERRLARIESAVAELSSARAAAPPMVATVVDSLDDAADRLAARGVSIDERVASALALAERLTEPGTLRALERLADAAEQAPAALATMTDTFDDLCERAATAGVDIDDRARNLVVALEKLTSPEALRVLQQVLDHVEVVGGLLESGVLDPAPVAIVGKLGEALATTSREESPSVGALGALRALGDPDVKRTVGFALRVAQRFGGAMREREIKALTAGSE